MTEIIASLILSILAHGISVGHLLLPQCVIRALSLIKGDDGVLPALRDAAVKYHESRAAPLEDITQLLAAVSLHAAATQGQQCGQSGQQQQQQQYVQQQHYVWQQQQQQVGAAPILEVCTVVQYGAHPHLVLVHCRSAAAAAAPPPPALPSAPLHTH